MPSTSVCQPDFSAKAMIQCPEIRDGGLGLHSGITRIFLLKRTEAVGPAGALLPKAEKTIALFAFLCLSGGRLISKDELADIFWENSNRERAFDSLRHAISSLARIDATWKLKRERRGASLDVKNCWIDAFEIADLPELLLQDIYGISKSLDRWIQGQRAIYERRWCDILEKQIAELTADSANPEQRAATARRLLGVLPSSGFGIRTLMTAFVDMDERAEAIRAFENYKRSIEEDGFPLSSETVALYTKIRENLGSSYLRRERIDHQVSVLEIPRTVQSQGTIGEPRVVAGEPSIAALPLRNLSGPEGPDYVVEGIGEDIVEVLSRVPGLFVVTRLSAAVFGKQIRSPQEIGTALGVRYLLSGSVRIVSDRIRLSIELIEAETGKGVWRCRFDEKTPCILEAQSALAEAVVRDLAPRLRLVELSRSFNKHPTRYNAYDFLLRAQESMHNTSRPVFDEAERFFDHAIERDPLYATALAWRAYWHVMRVGQGWSSDRDLDSSLAKQFAQRAIDCDPYEALGYAVRGHVAAYLYRDLDLALEYLERATQLNPNSARSWLWKANTHGWRCQGDAAVSHVNRAIALSPFDPLMFAFSSSACLAYLVDNQYERAIEFGMRAIRENRSYSSAYKLLIPALILSGNMAEGRHAANQLLRLEPRLTVAQFRRRSPGAGGETGALVCDALAVAGIPVGA
jgi:TolB-like protein/DNA-binding SARP family transcriptional activator